jgi:hypothetical protein
VIVLIERVKHSTGIAEKLARVVQPKQEAVDPKVIKIDCSVGIGAESRYFNRSPG